MAAGTQADKDKAALEAQEKEVERGTRAMDRGALAAQAAQQQIDSNVAATAKEEADAEAESYKKVKTDLDRKRLAQQAAAKAAAEAIDMAMDQFKASSEIAPQAPQALAQAMSQQNQQGPQ